MPTALELAKEREARKLKQHGLDPNGQPPVDETDEEREAREAEDRRLAALGDDDDDRGGDPGDDRGDGGSDGAEDLRQQIRALSAELAALRGRVAPSQQDAAAFKDAWNAEREARNRETAELRAQLEAAQQALEQYQAKAEFSLDDILSEEERRDIDPLVLSAFSKIATAAAERAAKKAAPAVDVRRATLEVLDERETKRVQDYRTRVMSDPTKGLHQLAQLAYDPKFIEWSKQDDNDVDSVVTSLLNAKSTEEVDRYAKLVARRINAFKESQKGGNRPTDARTSLGNHMRRQEKPKRTPQEVEALTQKAKNLARSRNPADRAEAQRILNELN